MWAFNQVKKRYYKETHRNPVIYFEASAASVLTIPLSVPTSFHFMQLLDLKHLISM